MTVTWRGDSPHASRTVAHVAAAGRLAAEALGLGLWYRWSARRRRFSAVAARADVFSPRAGHEVPAALVRAVSRAARLAPRGMTCLVRSLILARMLQRRGHAATIVIGVPSEGRGERAFAHAWVEMEPRGLDGYEELFDLPDGSGS